MNAPLTEFRFLFVYCRAMCLESSVGRYFLSLSLAMYSSPTHSLIVLHPSIHPPMEFCFSSSRSLSLALCPPFLFWFLDIA